MTKPPYKHRLASLQATLKPNQALFLANSSDIEYFTGFKTLVPQEREAFVTLTKKQTYLIHASFTPLPKNTNGLTLLAHASISSLKNHLDRILSENKNTTEFFIDESSLFVDEYKVLTDYPTLTLKPLDKHTIWKKRIIKDSSEITVIQESCQIAKKTYLAIKKSIQVGVTEKQLKTRLERTMEDLGSNGPAFPTIVAFGPHSALPHHQPTDFKLEKEMPILIDFGASVAGYKSDMTRSWWFGEHPDPEFITIKTVVDQAYSAAVDLLKRRSEKTELSAKRLDDTTRSVIAEAGYSQFFIHTTGHGLGLDIHEPPSLNWKNQDLIQPNMVITIEPGIYRENLFGYRYENTLLVTTQGATEFSL